MCLAGVISVARVWHVRGVPYRLDLMGRSASTPGIRARHTKPCGSRRGGRCNCNPTYQAWVFDARTGDRLWKTFPSHAAAKSWRRDAAVALSRGEIQARQTKRIRDAADELIDGMVSGAIINRSRDPYKPSAIRSYREAIEGYLKPTLGDYRLADVRHRDIQDLVMRLHAEGKSASTIRNAIMPLRVIFRHAVRYGEIAVNPCANLELPAVRGRRETIPTAAEGQALLDNLSDEDRPVWAVALYAGLRSGEIRGLQWDDVDLEKNVIRVRRSIDRGQVVPPKSAAGHRTVPIPEALRPHLLEQRLRNGRSRYVFGSGEKPLAKPRKVGKSFGLHECRHAYASFMIAAGVNAKTLTTYLGHASIKTTFDRYGHLFPGNEAEAAELLDAYLAGSSHRAIAP